MLTRTHRRLSALPPRAVRSFFAKAAEVTDDRWPGWQAVIGIEVHTQIRSRRKLYSNTLADFDASPNTHVSLFDAAFPGTLPILNKRCVDLATRTALALGARVHERSSFDRKHYFYADLPAGYQLTQHYSPLATEGQLHVTYMHKKKPLESDVRIKQIQLEQDTAKSTAQPGETFIDLNRAGVALMEIVSEPDMRTPEEAGAYVRQLQALLRAIGASNGNMEEGSLRCDVNVSVNRPGQPFGTRCEVKNLNSIKGLMIAINAEIFRHISLLSSGETVAQETRGFDEDRAETFKLRSKEDAPDYRYMPDPNLPPLVIDKAYIDEIQGAMPSLPTHIRQRLETYLLPERDIDVLMAMQATADVPFDGEPRRDDAVSYFEEVTDAMGSDSNHRVVANWITNELMGSLSYRGETFSPSKLPSQQLAQLIKFVQHGTITADSGKLLLRHLLESPSPDEDLSFLLNRLDLIATGSDGLHAYCEKAIAALPKEAAAARNGNANVVKRMVGEVMKLSQRRADAKAAEKMLRGMLGLKDRED